MKKSATVIATVVALLVTACTAPEPVVEQVEVTRLVDRTVEIDVTVPVTRIVEQTVEVQVTVPVTQVVEKTVEVTREVTREIPVTVLVTPALPSATATATATATAHAHGQRQLPHHPYRWLKPHERTCGLISLTTVTI